MKKLLGLALTVVMSAAVLTACGGSAAPEAPAPEQPAQEQPSEETETPEGEAAEGGEAGIIKMGGTGPLTGGAAIYGNAVKNGAQIAVDEINALGGLQIDLRYEDDEHDAEKAVNAYNSLKDWGMQVFLSSVTSTPAVATSAEAYSDRYFGLTPSASAMAAIEGNDNIYQMCFADPNQGLASAQYIFDKELGSKVAVIYKNDDVYSKGIFTTFEQKANELGLELVSITTFTEDSQTDFSVQLTDAQTNGADLVFLPIYYTPASLIFRQAADMGFTPKFFGVDGMDGILTLEGFDTALAEGVMLLTPFNSDSTDALTVNFVEKYQAAHGEVPNQFAADAYDCVYAIYKAINDSNGAITADMDAVAISEELIAIFNGDFSFDGVTGSGMTWSETGEVSKSPKGMAIENGAYVGMD